MKLVYTVLVLAALVYAERRLIEPRLTGARLSALVQAALVYKVLVYQEWIRSHHLLAPAERATRPQGTLLKSAHSLHSLEACDVYTKRVPTQWNGYRNCLWNCESVQTNNNNNNHAAT